MSGLQLLPSYDVLVVGAGLIGSSAARHLTRMKHSDGRQLTVCLVGPEEPTSRQDRTIFGAHYDEGRITRVTAYDFVWSTVAKRSIERYRDLERETGIRFYEEVGCLTIGEISSGFVAGSIESAVKCDARGLVRLNVEELLSRFPYLGRRDGGVRTSASLFKGASEAVLETADAGYINPRRLCLAEQRAAQSGGCHVIRDVVSDVVEDVATGNEAARMRIVTDGGLTLRARKVLIATGAFTDFRRLLPPGVRFDLEYLTQSVIFLEMSAEDLERTRNMPCMIVQSSKLGKNKKDEVDDKFDSYILPPIKYPTVIGKTYLKVGHGAQLERRLQSPEDIIQWYRNGVPDDDRRILQNICQRVFPDLSPLSVHYDNCVTTHTPCRRPYVDLVSPSLGVALGGNGYAAKSADEIGRIAADLLVSGQWSDDLPRETFRAARVTSVVTSAASGTSKL